MSRCLRWVLIAISVAAIAGSSPAQTPDTPTLLRVGDVISVNVWGFKDLSLDSVPVRPDGKVSVPTVGDVLVVGKTPAQVSSEIAVGLKKYISDPKVVVTLISSTADKYYVTGAVAKPGAFPLSVNPPTGVREAVAAAGDLAPDANTKSATILHSDGTRTVIDLEAAMTGSSNIMLHPGDTVSIEQALVTIEGAVSATGQQPLRRGTTLSAALATAGGVKDTADLERVQILRAPETIEVNLRAYFADPSRSITFLAGDIIGIPAEAGHLQVVRSGKPIDVNLLNLLSDPTRDLPLYPGDIVTEVPDLEHIKVLRGNYTVNLRRVIANPSNDVPLKPGDTIKVDLADVRTVPVLITGAVGHASTYRFVPGYRDTLQDAINWAGGLGGDADLGRVKITRSGSAQAPAVLTVDIRTPQGRGERLHPNDFIEVPRRRRSQAGNFLNQFGPIISLGLGLYTIFRKK